MADHHSTSTSTNGKKFIPAPKLNMPNNTIYSTGIIGVYLAPDEEVSWIWTHTHLGSYVSGYVIKKKGV